MTIRRCRVMPPRRRPKGGQKRDRSPRRTKAAPHGALSNGETRATQGGDAMAHVSRTSAETGRPRLIPGLVLAGVALICTSADARAAISVDQAGYKAGILTVEGRTTKAHQTVTLDGIYRARSDGSGSFRFRIRYRPSPLHDPSSIRHGYISRDSRQLPSNAMTCEIVLRVWSFAPLSTSALAKGPARLASEQIRPPN